MGSEAADRIEGVASTVRRRMGVFGVLTGFIGAVILAFFDTKLSIGFASGASIGLVNALWLMRIAKRGIAMRPEKAGRFVAVSYHVRFAATALAMAVLIVKGVFSPWALLAGLTVAIITTIGVMISAAREEASATCTE